MTWQPIETASKDKATVARFLFRDGAVEIGIYDSFWCGSDCPCGMDDEFEPDCWWVNEKPYPTHWQPL